MVAYPQGRFIEIGKRNIWTKDEMQRVRPDVWYETHSFNELIPAEPGRLRTMLQDLAVEMDARACRPLPAQVFELRGELVDAFRCLQGGANIGKVAVRVEPAPLTSPLWSGDGAVVITGGLGGLGIVTV